MNSCAFYLCIYICFTEEANKVIDNQQTILKKQKNNLNPKEKYAQIMLYLDNKPGKMLRDV